MTIKFPGTTNIEKSSLIETPVLKKYKHVYEVKLQVPYVNNLYFLYEFIRSSFVSVLCLIKISYLHQIN